MQIYLQWSQVIVAVLLIIVILVQVRGQGAGMFTQGQSTYRTRRGLEKTLFQFTIVLVAIFVLVSILSISKWAVAI